MQLNVQPNNEPCMIWPTLIDLNSVDLICCLFMVSLEKCNGSFNVVGNLSDNLSTKLCVPSKKKELDVKMLKYLI